MHHVNPQVRFLDLVDRETRAHDGTVDIVTRLKGLKRPLVGAEIKLLAQCEAILKAVQGASSTQVCDPLFVATRALLNSQALLEYPLLTQDKGRLVFELPTSAPQGGEGNDDPKDVIADQITLVSRLLGLLDIGGATPPAVHVTAQGTIEPVADDPANAAFTGQFFDALGKAKSNPELAERVLAILCIECDPDGRGGQQPGVLATEFARVMQGLETRKVDQDLKLQQQLRRRVNEELNKVQNVGGEDAIADLGIDLPDLENLEDANIVADNVRVMGPMIVAAMFDELKVFQVVDRIVEQFQHGTLPIGPGNAGKLLYRYWRETPNRISEQERRNFAAITLGVPGGDPGAAVNREFNDLWIRFVSSVSSFVRQTEVDALLRANVPNPINHQQVRKAARDLAGNLSLHGFGMAHYAAREIQYQVKFMIDLLQDPEIRGCYAAKDMWQVIDQVATYELGGAKTSSRYRTLATCGTIITAWLANNVTRINKATGPLLRVDEIANPDVSSNHKSTLNPTDYDLVNACELWLADTATTDTQIEQFSQPREAPQMTSKPVTIPAMAREMLDGIGDLGASVGLGKGTPVPAGYGLNKGSGYYSNRRH